MAYAGQTIENPVSGEKITFIQTAADTDGELLEIELELSAEGAVPGAHIHPEQEERFEVIEGTMAFRMGLKKIVAGPGEVVTVPAGKVHAFKNAGDDTAKVRVQVRPALQMEQLSRPRSRSLKTGARPARACPSRSTSRCSCASTGARSRPRSRRRRSCAPCSPRSPGWRRARDTASATRPPPASSSRRSDPGSPGSLGGVARPPAQSRTGRILAGVAVMLILTAALVLGGVYYMLTQFGDELDSELDSQVRTVQRDFDGDVRRLQRDLEQELDERLPAAVPTP
jgi:quercetin dioxygenase-like cupin family protein